MRATRVAIAVAVLLGCALAASVSVEGADGPIDAEEAVRQGLVGRIGTKGDDEDQEMEMGEAPYAPRMPGLGHPAVKVSAMFPDHYGKEIPAGEDVEMLVWFANKGSRPITVRGVVAFLLSAMDANRYIQNFTPRILDLVVEPKSEETLSYKFHPSEYLTAMPYRFYSVIEYYDEHQQVYQNVLHNETLQFAEAHVAFDFELIVTYGIIIAAFGGSLYGLYYCFTTKTKLGKKLAKKKRTMTAKPAAKGPVAHEDNEWLKGTHAVQSMRNSKKH